MQLEALWTVSFASSDGSASNVGGGVVIFETNRIFGGDAGYYYLGNFTITNGVLEGNVQIVKHGSEDSIFGSGDKFEFTLSGKYEEGMSEFILEGMTTSANGKPTVVAVKLVYRAKLPG